MLDAGDALSPMNTLVPDQRERVEKTAELIVQQYAAQKVEALAIGDRDIALGPDALKKLAQMGVPFVATNLVEAESGARVFKTWVLVERNGMRIQVLALVGARAERFAKSELDAAKWRYENAIDAAKKAIAELTPPADMVVVLSQMANQEEDELRQTLPEVRVFLGGDGMGMSSEVFMLGDGAAISANGAQKGKQVGMLTLSLDDERGIAAPFVDPNRRKQLEGKKASSEQRVKSLEKIIADAKAKGEEAGKVEPSTLERPAVRKAPIEAYERQLAGARAELQLATDELAGLPTGEQKTGNVLSFELVQMDPSVADEPTTKAAVDAFRKIYPDPTKPAPPPQPQRDAVPPPPLQPPQHK